MVNQFFSTRLQLNHLATLLAGCLLLGTSGPACWAQSSQAASSTKAATAVQEKQADQLTSPDGQPSTPKVEQAKIVRSIYELTKTTKSAKQLSEFLARCDQALGHKLNSKNTQYVTSLKGWALNLRGQHRMTIALQLKQIGNSQYDSALQQAMADFDQAILNGPDRYRSFMSRGIALAQTGEFKKAALDFTNVIKLKTDLADAWFNRAESLYHLGKFEAAIGDYQTVLRLQSDDVQALTGLGHAKLASGQSAEALADYQTVAKLQPESPNAYVNIGDAFSELGNWQLAQSNFDKSISIKPTGIALQRAAWLKATCPEKSFRDPAQAISLVNRAISLDGDSVINLDTLAAAQAAAGKFDVAKTTQKQTIVLASAVEDIATETSDESPYKARLMLYEEEVPFTQTSQPASTE